MYTNIKIQFIQTVDKQRIKTTCAQTWSEMLEKFISQPKKLFLLDGLGATLSAFLLGVVLVKLERTFGIPSQSLYILATLPVIFVIYDLYCIRKTRTDEGPLLKGIALINLSYCCISIVFAFYLQWCAKNNIAHQIFLSFWFWYWNEQILYLLQFIPRNNILFWTDEYWSKCSC